MEFKRRVTRGHSAHTGPFQNATSDCVARDVCKFAHDSIWPTPKVGAPPPEGPRAETHA